MKLLMNKSKQGYISIEIVIVIAIVLLGGTIGISKYSAKGKESTSKTNETVAKVYKDSADVDLNISNSNNSGSEGNNNTQIVNMLIKGEDFQAMYGTKGLETISFIKGNPEECDGENTDISVAKDGRIKACLVGNDLIVKSKEIVYANQNCTRMFSGVLGVEDGSSTSNKFIYLKKINFENFDVKYTKTFKCLFHDTGRNASNFEIIGISDWDLKNAGNLFDIFAYTCAYSKTCKVGDLSKWDVSNVTELAYGFTGFALSTNNPPKINIENWTINKKTRLYHCFNAYNSSSEWKIPNWYNIEKWDK